jgi:hypothetical protein
MQQRDQLNVQDYISMDQGDPFTGTWKFDVDKSRLSTPPPQNWIQEIKVTPSQVGFARRF